MTPPLPPPPSPSPSPSPSLPHPSGFHPRSLSKLGASTAGGRAVTPWSADEQQTLVQLLQDQVSQYRLLFDLTQQQGELVDRHDADALLSLLGRRQTFIDRLAKLNVQLQPLKENWDAQLASLSPSDKQVVTALLADIQQFQQAIRQQDDRDFALLQQAKDQTGEQIGQLKQTAQATKSYHQAATAYRYQQPTSLYTDHRY